MYSDKKEILQLVALLKAHHIDKVVICPGSRNAPIAHTLSHVEGFTCYSITDERSAAYYALGLALNGGKAVAVCCTSGTAVLNMTPAVAEAYYQQVPLVVISADRPSAWIGQMDGQTIPQAHVFGNMVKKAVYLPSIHTDEDEWHCNRLINEALLATYHHGKGPVHINIPLSEPLFNYSATTLPEVRVIHRFEGLNNYQQDYSHLLDLLNKYKRRMVIAGQMNQIYVFEKRSAKMLYKQFAWLTEHLSNRVIPGQPIKNFDLALYLMSEEEKEKMRPDLLITYGGHIVSKRLKEYLRKHPPREHWHVDENGEIADVFGCLTNVIEMSPMEFLEKIAPIFDNITPEFPRIWENKCKSLPIPQFGYSSMKAVEMLIQHLPQQCTVHSANSSVIRYLQIHPLPAEVEFCCNRGTNGIEGSLSTAIGYAAVSSNINFILIGDLSFFYDMNILGHQPITPNVRILLLNNGGGEIFHTVGGLKMDETSETYITAPHHSVARAWVESQGITYLSAQNEEELSTAMESFTQPQPSDKPMLLELFVPKGEDAKELRSGFKRLKENNINNNN